MRGGIILYKIKPAGLKMQSSNLGLVKQRLGDIILLVFCAAGTDPVPVHSPLFSDISAIKPIPGTAVLQPDVIIPGARGHDMAPADGARLETSPGIMKVYKDQRYFLLELSRAGRISMYDSNVAPRYLLRLSAGERPEGLVAWTFPLYRSVDGTSTLTATFPSVA
jgi:hypothetical protein